MAALTLVRLAWVKVPSGNSCFEATGKERNYAKIAPVISWRSMILWHPGYRLSSLQLSSYTRTFYASTSNIMTLDLTTDFTVNDKGFKAAWKEVNWTGTRMWLVGLYSNLQFLINCFVLIFRAQHLCIYDPCELMGLHCCDFFGHISF